MKREKQNYDITLYERRKLLALRRMPQIRMGGSGIDEFRAWTAGYAMGIGLEGESSDKYNILPDGLNAYAEEKFNRKGTGCDWLELIQRHAVEESWNELPSVWAFLDEYLEYRGMAKLTDWEPAPAQKEELEKYDCLLFGEPEPRDFTRSQRCFLASLRKRPGVYCGSNSIRSVYAFLTGHRAAVNTLRKPENMLFNAQMELMLRERYAGMGADISSIGRLIAAADHDEEKAAELFWGLIDDYLTAHGWEKVPEWRPLDCKTLAVPLTEDITPAERTLLGRLRKVPGAYIGTNSGNAFFLFCKGYALALKTIGKTANRILPQGFAEAAECLYDYSVTEDLTVFHVFDYLDACLEAGGFDPIAECALPKAVCREYHGETPAKEPVYENIGEAERRLLCSIRNHPEAIFGETRKPLTCLSAFKDGYHAALLAVNDDSAGMPYAEHQLIPGDMHRFAAMRYLGYERSAKGWATLLLERETDEQKAFAMFWELLDDYLLEIGAKPLIHGNLDLCDYWITSITKEVLPTLAASFADCFNAAPWNDSWTQEQALERLTDICNTPKFDGMAAYVNGKLAGVILGRGEQYFDGVHFQILEFWTAHALQGCGIGKRLLSDFTAHLEAQGIRKQFLLTMRSERTEGFYRKQGYQTADEMCLMMRDTQ